MNWTSTTFDPLKLLLDIENPRIDLAENSDQSLIRLRLLETEDVGELAKKIIDAGGLLAGERIIVTRENGKHVVLEGNRRTCACQLLLDPKLIPFEFRGRFPKTSDSELRESLRSIQADVAPNRAAAEYTITQRHTQPGILGWRPMAQYRRVQRLLSSGTSIAQVSEEFGVQRSAIVKILRQGALLAAAQALPVWTEAEAAELRSPKLKTNPYTRFFTLQGVRDTLGVTFDEADGSLKRALDERLSDRIIELLARAFLLTDPASGKTRYNTRTAPQTIYGFLQDQEPDLGAIFGSALENNRPTEPPPAGRPTGARPNAPNEQSMDNQQGTTNAGTDAGGPVGKRGVRARTFKFFEGLQCPTTNSTLFGFADEISRIDYKKFKISAAFLARGLMEQSLIWSLKTSRQYGLLRQQLGTSREPGLSDLIRFCIANQASIFIRNPSRVLNQWTNSHKDYCDLIVHGLWIKATPEILEHLAAETRGLIEDILSGEIVKTGNP